MSAELLPTQSDRGLFLEEFYPGFSISTRHRTITDADVAQFAQLTGDFSELHTNEAYARTNQYGRPVAHGALVFSVAIGLTTGTNVLDGTLVALARVDNLRFVRPVFPGDRISVTKAVIAAEARGPDRGLVSFDTRVRNQHGDIVIAFVDRLLVKRVPTPGNGGISTREAEPAAPRT